MSRSLIQCQNNKQTESGLVDDHHTAGNVCLALGYAFKDALGAHMPLSIKCFPVL